MLNKYGFPKRQSGVVLMISLIMLLLLTLIGVTGTQVTGLEERMAGNVRDQNLAFQAAEAALKEAERFINNNPIDSTVYTGNNGLLDLDPTHVEPDFFDSSQWVDATSASTPVNFNTQYGIPSNPRYIIKRIYQNGSTEVLRITARALGRNAGTQVILQEIFEPDP